ncbi:hypothetical protein [Georgenia sp. Z1491]|uniref:hypothetical protein n=1 Tax=Georgenia sp. Z1491 TaxID=3416707 RepID=UPI003CE8EB3C
MARSDDALHPDVQVGMYSFRTPEPVRLATFWGELMGLPMADGASDQIAMLDLDHEVGPITWLFEPDLRHQTRDLGPASVDLTRANRVAADLEDEATGGECWTVDGDRG